MGNAPLTSPVPGDVNEAFVTLATNDHCAHGVLTLGASLRRTGTKRNLVAMLTAEVSEDMRMRIGKQWNEVKIVEEMNGKDKETLALIQRPELAVASTKLRVWELTEYSKCVFLDADTIVLANIDELFEREQFSTAPDIGWPELLSTGVFVMRPCLKTFTALSELAIKTVGGYDGSVLSPSALDISDDELVKHFMKGVLNVAAVSLAIEYPTAASVSHSIVNGFMNLLAIAVATDITFKEAELVKTSDEDLINCFMQGVSNVAAVSLAIGYPTAASVSHSIVNGFKNLLAIAVATDITFKEAELVKTSDEDLVNRFMEGMSNVAAVSLAIEYPTAASVPHSIINGFKNLLAIAVATDITFKEADKTKALVSDLEAEAEAEEEEDEESDEDIGMGLFDD